MKKAREAYNQGEYRWTATLLNHLVFANPKHKPARQLLADTYAQLGYQAESGPWRNFYLTGAMELTEGIAGKGKANSNRARMSQNLSPEMLFDLLAIQINGDNKYYLNRHKRTGHLDLKERRFIEPHRPAPSGPYRNFGRRQTSHLRKPHAAGEYSGKSAKP